jgi:hypothetical protein
LGERVRVRVRINAAKMQKEGVKCKTCERSIDKDHPKFVKEGVKE